jgi:uncharacterized protein involved in tolerance to divalent cations
VLNGISNAVKELHAYETPSIMVLPVASVEQNYLGWLLAETEPAIK